ncbi:hypothetical protein [Flavobacterium sp.]|uniref:hypothetical protein n=1 Tax=Flavobacteriaceae TaxID=49546 RepID=UPI00404882ED
MKIKFYLLANLSIAASLLTVMLTAGCNQQPAPQNTQPVIQATPAPVDNKADKDKSINSVKAYIDDIESKVKAIEEAMKGNDFSTISEHAGEIEDLASKIKQEATNFSTTDFELIKRDVSDIQHGGDEIKDAVKGHKHEDIHHEIETLKEHIKQLKEDVSKL